MNARKQPDISPCGWCVSGNHRSCRGALPRPAGPDGEERFTRCACADAEHQPADALALVMARSLRPDLAQAGGVLLDEMVAAVQARGAAFAASIEEAAA